MSARFSPALRATLLAAALSTALLWAGAPSTSAGPPDPILVGAGDISTCANTNDEATALLLDALFTGEPPGAVFTAGDNAYEIGATDQYNMCYDPTWGRHKSRTNPSPGNHEYYTLNAGGYFGYFGAAAGSPTEGYYSYDLGVWHVVAINSNCSAIGGCGAGSPQEQWLRADLAASAADCTLAYWHHPRFSSGQHGNDAGLGAIWQALFDHGVDLVINGHDHNYERFAPQDPSANLESVRGIREIVAGTGGRSLRPFATIVANSELRDYSTYGVIKLTLHPASYDWQFIPIAGGTFTDSGSQACLTPDFDDDTDGDGCTDLDELRTVAGSELVGGRRDPANFWDLFDVWTGTAPNLTRNKAVAAPDFFAVLGRFGTTGTATSVSDALTEPVSATGYHAAFDRGGTPSPFPWSLMAADGSIAAPDFFQVLAQFGHSCA